MAGIPPERKIVYGRMENLKRYFRLHPWQRRVVSILLVLILGSVVGRLTYPWYLWFQRRQADLRLIEQLGDADAYHREVAVQKAILLGEKRDELVARLIDALDTPDDGRFASLQYVLLRLGRWNPPTLDSKWRDRYVLLEFRATFSEGEKEQTPSARDRDTPAARSRRRLLRKALLSGRENLYIQEILLAGANDPSAIVRQSAGALAARLGDDGVLRALLHDPSGKVRAVAALDAGLAKRTALLDPVRRLFDAQWNLVGPPAPDRIDQIASAAYCLSLLDPQASGKTLCRAAAGANPPELQDRLLPALANSKDETARQTVLDILHASRWNGRYPSGIALHVAGRMHLPEATAMAMEVLHAAGEGKENLTTQQVLGAMDVVTTAKYPCRSAAYKLSRVLWQPGREALLTRAAKLLGEQTTMKGQGDDAPDRAKCIETLRRAVEYSMAAEGKPLTTPLSSAAAAVALWRLDPATRVFARQEDNTQSNAPLDREEILRIVESKTSLFYLREATVSTDPAAGDFIAWNVAHSRLPEATGVGETFFPAANQTPPEYSPAVRACGAMILALTAKDPQQRRDLVERIERRRKREDFPATGSLQCALLMAGKSDPLAKVRMLLELEEFPAARALLALLVVGDKTALDWVLWNTNRNLPVPLEDLPPLLIDQVIGDVLRTVAPSLPTISPAGSDATRLWQARILRHAYGIHRATLRVGVAR